MLIFFNCNRFLHNFYTNLSIICNNLYHLSNAPDEFYKIMAVREVGQRVLWYRKNKYLTNTLFNAFSHHKIEIKTLKYIKKSDV